MFPGVDDTPLFLRDNLAEGRASQPGFCIGNPYNLPLIFAAGNRSLGQSFEVLGPNHAEFTKVLRALLGPDKCLNRVMYRTTLSNVSSYYATLFSR
jgi:hypothetical protein